MKRTIGVFAHVDAGKTTFCEALLHLSAKTRKWGRVEEQNTVMDHEPVERQRGITVFADVASFSWQEQEFYLIDTPGHGDFSAEMERALGVIDAAVLLISGLDGIQSQTLLLFRLLKKRAVPVFFFINKADLDIADIDACVAELKCRLSRNCFRVEKSLTEAGESLTEWLAEYDEAVLEQFLAGRVEAEVQARALRRLISEAQGELVFAGSALKGEGVLPLLEAIRETVQPVYPATGPLRARVFKISHDEKGNKVAFVKMLAGQLAVKDTVSYPGRALTDKVHEIRCYQGREYAQVPSITAGDVAGLTGLSAARAGMGLGELPPLPEPELKPALTAAVRHDGIPFETVMSGLRKLEAQDPLLTVTYDQAIKEINIHIMGPVQLEVLQALTADKYGLTLEFGESSILYKETVAAPVVGYGHYEPLRHYAEVHVGIEPNPGGGVVYESRCHPDRLAQHHQNVILGMLKEKEHKGLLTGSGLTDVKLVLLNGAVHEKHTEGGDLRQAAFRAVRQGLEKAELILLEPCYELEIQAPAAHLGRILADLTRLTATFEPPLTEGEQVVVKARGPVKNFLDYPAQLAAFTQGRGAIAMSFGGYAPCHETETIVTERGYEKERDLENTSSSVFCAKGAGFEVKWQEAETMMHLR